jgi:hypothetical protein
VSLLSVFGRTSLATTFARHLARGGVALLDPRACGEATGVS